ncbi:MAG: hypothetical protein DLM69_06875 [Candidatus Chloroheliales bacterium]|nr:MAG: hypothetical protein DLM69_06875 [Chloroflexota bacterium]
MYIDEVGNPGLGQSNHPNNQFLSLTGLITELDNVPAIQNQMDTLKMNYFGSSNVIFHRNDIERGNGVFLPLLNQQIRQSFNHELEGLLASWNFTLVTVCMDKVSFW